MTKQEQKDFDKLITTTLKANTLVPNEALQSKARLGKNTYASTAVIPTFKFLKAVRAFTQKYRTKK